MHATVNNYTLRSLFILQDDYLVLVVEIDSKVFSW